MVKVKICGLKEEKHVLSAVDAGATWIGFMFAPSKRQISIERAAELANLVPSHVKKLVFSLIPLRNKYEKLLM